MSASPAERSTEVLTPHLPRGAGRWLLVVVFVAGAALMTFELVGSRLLAPFFGNSIYVWGSLIGVFLGALSAGYAIGGRVADRFPSAGALALILAGASVLAGLATVLGDPVQEAVVRWNPGLRLNPLVSAVLLFGPASVLMGMVSPYAVRLSTSEIRRVGSTAGALYGLSTVGSIVGTIGTAFWAVDTVGSEKVVLGVAAMLGACSLLAALASSRRAPLLASAAALAAVGLLAVAGAGYEDELEVRTGNNSPVLKAAGYREPVEPQGDGRVRLRTDSSYHRIRVVDYAQGVNASSVPARLLHFDASMQAAVALDESGEPDTEALPVFAYLASIDLLPRLRPDADRALFIGLGSGAAPLRLNQLMPDIEIDVVEIDPEVVEVAREWFGYHDGGGQISTHVGDGRSWLAASDAEYDIVMVDAYNADSIPFHLTTREFLDVVQEHLAPGGLVHANLIGAVEGRRSNLLRSLVKTYEAEFGHVEVYPVATGPNGPLLDRFGNVQLFASDDEVPTPRARRGDSEHLQRLIEHRYARDIPTDNVPVLTDDYAPVDGLSIHEEDA